MFKFILQLILVCFLVLNNLNAQNTINGGTVFGNWIKSKSPYYIKGNIYVPKDSTLIIEPGVQIRFDGKYSLAVYGKLKVIGKQGDSIRFYSGDTFNRWKGIRFFGTKQIKDSAVFVYCIFEQSGPKITNFDCALHITKGHFLISNCTFRYNRSVQRPSCILADSLLSLSINNCYFYRNTNININPSFSSYGAGGTVAITNGNVSNCIFKENTSKNSFYNQDDFSTSGSGGILYISDFSEPNLNINIVGCKFIGNITGSHSAGITPYLRRSGKVRITDCLFTDNFTGSYGCISFLAEDFDTKGNYKLSIDGCTFTNNRSACSNRGPGIACITALNFQTNDSLIIRRNIFEKTIGLTSILISGEKNDKDIYLISNVFRNNLSNSIVAESGETIISMNNLHYNNLNCNYTFKNPEFYSINDAYLFNGPKTDTISLPQKWMISPPGTFYLFFGGNFHDEDNGGHYRNCIFWNNFDGKGKLAHLITDAGVIGEVTNCIFNGQKDSVIKWGGKSSNKPSSLITLLRNYFSFDPMFINPPTTYGPDVNSTGLDFHIINSCFNTSPAYDAGWDSTFLGLYSNLDLDGSQRIVCNKVDIGPYELKGKKRQIELGREPLTQSGCPGSNFILDGKVECGMDIQYNWQKKQNNGVWSNINGALSNQYTGSFSDSGSYRLIVRQLECNLFDTSKTVKVIEYPVYNPNLGRDTTIKDDKSLILDAGIGKQYKWNTNDTSRIVIVDGKSINIGKHNYFVTVTNSFGCKASDTIEITIEKNIGFNSIESSLWKVFPNPAINSINIVSPGDESYEWFLLSHMGQEIMKGSSKGSNSVDVGFLQSGYYFIIINYNGNEYSIRFIKN